MYHRDNTLYTTNVVGTRYTRHSVVHTIDTSTNTQHYTRKSMYVTLYTTHTGRHTAGHMIRGRMQTIQISTHRKKTHSHVHNTHVVDRYSSTGML